MKKFFISAIISLASLCATADYPQWLHIYWYADQNKELQSTPNENNRVIFLGNSITELWVRDHGKFFKENPGFHGRGISGETTWQFLNRFREDVINNSPAIVVINGGTNDIAENAGTYNEDYTFENIVSMVELAQLHGIKVILTSVLPVKTYSWNQSLENVPEKIISLNKRIKEYARQNNIPYADYYSSMVMEDLDLNPAYTYDGVHPVPAGFEVMESIILPIIKDVFNEGTLKK